MNEAFLYYVWKYHLYDKKNLQTTNKEELKVIKNGIRNRSSGPDFIDAKIQIDDIVWIGTVEIHIKTSDWVRHNHQVDKAFNNVILHVVYEHDKEIENQEGQKIPVLELKDRLDSIIWERYHNFISSKTSFIPCEKALVNFDNDFVKKHSLERLAIERFESKTLLIQEKLTLYSNDWEALLFFYIARYLGANVNQEAIELVVSSFDFSIVKKCYHNKKYLEALFLGQAGFLEKNQDDDYLINLQKEYRFLQSKYNLKPFDSSIFKFYGVRPPNYPTIRLVQLASLYSEYQNLFSFLIRIQKKEHFYPLFEFDVDPYWKEHYHFGRKSKKYSERYLSRLSIDLILINVILPIRYCYFKEQGTNTIEIVQELLMSTKPEKNNIVKDFSELKFKANDAWESQGLIQLKTMYCNQKKCLNCEIGNQLLKR